MLKLVVFICGAVVMIFELVGSRMLGPYFGTSIFVWTSLIGIILGSLSVGYYIGGKLADQKPIIHYLSSIIFLAALSIFFALLIKDPLLVFLRNITLNDKIGSVFASIFLFFPASMLLGMVSPYAVKLTLHNLNTSGSTAGNLYALSTIGSIVGTFFAGFYLIPWFGTNSLLTILVIVLCATSLLLERRFLGITLLLFTTFIASLFIIMDWSSIFKKNGVVDIDTTYNRIWIYDTKDTKTGEMVRKMGINNENHSSMFLKSDELVNEYTKYYDMVRHFNPTFRKALMLGGGGYSYPKDYLRKYPENTIDVVEIDPAVTRLAKQFFNLKDNPRLRIYHEDGRTHINRTRETYDVIFSDAFTSRYAVPYQLTTQEAIEKQYNILNDGGLVILNIISALEGDNGKFLRAEYATYKQIFPQVYLFPVQSTDALELQNIILVALKSNQKPLLTSTDQKIHGYLQHIWKSEIQEDMPILTDDHAPVEYYINNII